MNYMNNIYIYLQYYDLLSRIHSFILGMRELSRLSRILHICYVVSQKCWCQAAFGRIVEQCWLKQNIVHIYIYVWKLNQTVLELDLRAVKFLFFTRRDLNPHHWHTAAPFAYPYVQCPRPLDHIHSLSISCAYLSLLIFIP